MSLGQRIARLRQERNLTLHEVAGGTGLTPSFLSRLERDLVNISVANLRKLARFFNVPMTYFFAGEESGSLARLIHADARPCLSQPDADVQVYALTPPGSALEARLIDARPGASQSSDSAQLVYLLRGQLRYQVGAESYTLAAGDGLYVQHKEPQRWECFGSEPAAFLVVWANCRPF